MGVIGGLLALFAVWVIGVIAVFTGVTMGDDESPQMRFAMVFGGGAMMLPGTLLVLALIIVK